MTSQSRGPARALASCTVTPSHWFTPPNRDPNPNRNGRPTNPNPLTLTLTQTQTKTGRAAWRPGRPALLLEFLPTAEGVPSSSWPPFAPVRPPFAPYFLGGRRLTNTVKILTSKHDLDLGVRHGEPQGATCIVKVT